MDKKIVVPEGMLRAAYDAQLPADNPTFGWEEADEHIRQFYRRILGAALRWLSENPIVPTKQQAWMLFRDGPNGCDVKVWTAIEWQRRMFLDPEPQIGPAAQKILSTAQGCTFTPEEYKAIEHSVRTATNWQDSPKETR